MGAFDAFLAAHGAPGLLGAAALFFFAGFVKGAVGFALPLIAVSVGSMFLPAPTAVALLIGPALVGNGWQALRFGGAEALDLLRKYAVLTGVTLAGIALSAPLLVTLPEQFFYATLGLGVTLFCLVNGLRLRLPDPRRAPKLWETGMGALAGFFGGFAGIWGPPILMYLIARQTPKRELVTTTGVNFALGSVVLLLSHIRTGAFDASVAPLSLALVAPTLAGMRVGMAVQDRLEQRLFTRLVLALLALAGLNLLRRAVMG